MFLKFCLKLDDWWVCGGSVFGKILDLISQNEKPWNSVLGKIIKDSLKDKPKLLKYKIFKLKILRRILINFHKY